ncbi:unnamed protein product, partial [Nesidiocoris tenuis]
PTTRSETLSAAVFSRWRPNQSDSQSAPNEPMNPSGSTRRRRTASESQATQAETGCYRIKSYTPAFFHQNPQEGGPAEKTRVFEVSSPHSLEGTGNGIAFWAQPPSPYDSKFYAH